MILLSIEEKERQDAEDEEYESPDEEMSDKPFFRPDRVARRKALTEMMRRSHEN